MFDQKISIKSNMFHLCLVRWIGGWDCLWMDARTDGAIYIYVYMINNIKFHFYLSLFCHDGSINQISLSFYTYIYIYVYIDI